MSSTQPVIAPSASPSGPGVLDDFVSRLHRALLTARNEFQEFQEIALRFIPKKQFHAVTGRLENEALFLSIAAYSLQTPVLFGSRIPLYSDDDYCSVLSLQMGLAAEALCAVEKRQAAPLRRLFFNMERNKQGLIEKMRERSIVYYDLRRVDADILRKYFPISAAKRMQHDELLYLPTMREFLAACSGADASVDALNPTHGRSDAGQPKDVVTRSLLLQMQVALTRTQFAIQDHLRTSGLIQ